MLCCFKHRSRDVVIYLLSLFSLCCKTTQPSIEYTHRVFNKNQQHLEEEQNLSRIYRLKKSQDYDFEERFKNEIEKIYQKVYNEHQVVFTYTLSPFGAIYSFSEVIVRCIPDKKLSKSYQACYSFLKSVDDYYNTIKEELK